MRTLTATLLAALTAMLACAAPAAQADHEGPFGTNFGLADAVDDQGTHVDVFNTPKAFWAGPCDTEAQDASGSGMGTPPSPLLHCIDPGAAYFDFADQGNPDPPVGTTWQPGGEPSWRLDTADQAGAHPDLSLSFWLRRTSHSPFLDGGENQVISDGEPKDFVVSLPAGFLGNPNALPQCPAAAARLTPPPCPPETQVGVAEISLARLTTPTPGGGSHEGDHQRVPIFNVEPRKGKLAEFILAATVTEVSRVSVPIVARARTEGDFGIDSLAVNLPSGFPTVANTVTLWGVPWDASHDKYRPATQAILDARNGIPPGGLPDALGNQPQGYEWSWGPVRPFLINPTECAPSPLVTGISMASWRFPDDVRSYAAPWDEPISGCGDVPFDASFGMEPTTAAADGPTGLSSEVTVPQLGDAPFEVPDEGDSQSVVDDYVEATTEFWRSGDSGSGPTDEHLSTSNLEKAVVTLPEGVSVNPSAAAGLAGCSDALVGVTQAGVPPLFDNDDPFDGQGNECPDGSKIGSVEVYSPVLPPAEGEQPGDANLTGDVILGVPKSTDPQSGEMFRLFLVLRSEARGLVAKTAGSAVADPVTGRLTATFEQNPRVPFETLHVELKGGDRGTLAMPQRCQAHAWTSTLTPWSAAHGGGGLPVTDTGAFTPTSRCGFGFSPQVQAGTSDRRGGGTGAFSFVMSRQDGEQWLQGLTAKLPQGLLASVGDVPLCSNAQAAAAACPAASRLGTIDAAAGSGTPFVLERKGDVYLTEGYKGAPYGLASVVPVEVAPFTGQFALSTIVVRQALRVDPATAEVTVESDPFPRIHHGIPLRVRRVTVVVDRPGFMRNPTDCSQKEIVPTLASTEGASSTSPIPFQAAGCGALGFGPKLALRLTGKKQTRTGGHPGVRAQLVQPGGQAGIERVEVRLPKALALDPDNAQALCEYEDGIKPDLENHCPKGSIIGRARAVSPLLSRPLAGNVYFVKNVRRSASGNLIRTLPMLIVALRGEIAVNVRGTSDAKGGKLVNTFAAVPDAPVEKFNMNLAGGANGILQVTRTRRSTINLCAARRTAEVDIDGHNGRRADQDVRLKTPCAKKTKAAKKKAAKKKQRSGSARSKAGR